MLLEVRSLASRVITQELLSTLCFERGSLTGTRGFLIRLCCAANELQERKGEWRKDGREGDKEVKKGRMGRKES